MAQIEVPEPDIEALADILDMAIEEYRSAKDHTLSCPSVESPEQLLVVVADYDMRRAALQRVRIQIEEQR